jgi:hypothetical protein
LDLGYIHIKPAQTGSTYIRKTFVEHVAVFKRFGISYPLVFPPSTQIAMPAQSRSAEPQGRCNETGKATSMNPILIGDRIFGGINLRKQSMGSVSTCDAPNPLSFMYLFQRGKKGQIEKRQLMFMVAQKIAAAQFLVRRSMDAIDNP